MLLPAFLDTASRHGRKLAIRDVRREVTYDQLVVAAAALKRFIESETRRENIGILLPSTAAFAASFYGGLWAGKTVVPLNFLLHPTELKAVVADSGVDLILTCNHFEDLVRQLPARAAFLERIGLKWRYLLSKIRSFPPVPAVRPDDLAVILYTSGTTGMPRGVCLSHRNLYHDVTACIEHTHMDPEQRFLGVLPLFHTFGLTALLLAPTILGAGCSYHARFQPLDVLRTLAEDQISIFIAIPSMYAALARAKSASPEMFRSLRLPISGGEPLSPDLYDEYRDRFGVTILEGYGLTETSPVVAVNLPWANRAGTVGTPLPGVEVMSAGEDGRPVPPGESGEICVRGPTVMRGYYNRPDDTAAVLGPDGWLHTGDLGRIDPDGFISITGRKKDLIIVGGENVFPREVETVLEQHPAVAESSVIGISDPSRGEVVVGFVIPREGASVTPLELRDFCRDRLAGFKVPRQIIIDRDLPRGPTGKVLKRVLRARMQDQRACAGVS